MIMKIVLILLMHCGLLYAGELKLVSYNIHHGQGMDGKLDLNRIATHLKKQNPDFVALQEVDNKVARSGDVDQARELAKQLEMKSAFGKCIDLGGGGYGNAILSKFPILETHIHRLPGQGEPRVALEIVVEVNQQKLSVISVHLDHRSEATRVQQVVAIEHALSTRNHPIIMLGDLNALPASKTMLQIQKKWKVVPKTGSALTYPADTPRSEIDYMLIQGFSSPRVSSKVIDAGAASDHRPLLGLIDRPSK